MISPSSLLQDIHYGGELRTLDRLGNAESVWRRAGFPWFVLQNAV